MAHDNDIARVGDGQGDAASFDDFKAAYIDAALLGVEPREAAMLIARAECVEHATRLFEMAAEAFTVLDVNGVAARRARAITAAVRLAVAERDGGACVYCGTTEGPFHVDHVRPVVAGGDNSIDNLALACASCNLSKGGRSVREWKGSRRG